MADLPFRVEILEAPNERVEALIATAATFIVAQAAFVAAASQYPTRIITLRNLSHVMARHDGTIGSAAQLIRRARPLQN
jgi:hypothetical protein